MRDDMEFIVAMITIIGGFYKLTKIEHSIRELIKTTDNKLNVHLEESKGKWQLIDYQISDVKIKLNEIRSLIKISTDK